MKINISAIENENAISEVQSSAATKVVGGESNWVLDYIGNTEGENPWFKANVVGNTTPGKVNVGFSMSAGIDN